MSACSACRTAPNSRPPGRSSKRGRLFRSICPGSGLALGSGILQRTRATRSDRSKGRHDRWLGGRLPAQGVEYRPARARVGFSMKLEMLASIDCSSSTTKFSQSDLQPTRSWPAQARACQPRTAFRGYQLAWGAPLRFPRGLRTAQVPTGQCGVCPKADHWSTVSRLPRAKVVLRTLATNLRRTWLDLPPSPAKTPTVRAGRRVDIWRSAKADNR
jgi:hypothetical protein